MPWGLRILINPVFFFDVFSVDKKEKKWVFIAVWTCTFMARLFGFFLIYLDSLQNLKKRYTLKDVCWRVKAWGGGTLLVVFLEGPNE